MKYRFDKEKHIHYLGDQKLLSVTKVINSVIAKPALVQWAANKACEYVEENLDCMKSLPEVLKKAKTAHKKTKNKSGTWGSEVHDMLEKYIKKGLAYEGLDDMKMRTFKNFLEWVDSTGSYFVESEKSVWSEDLGIGGILDGIVLIGNKKWILDFKTGSGIYPEYFVQMGAYDMCIEEEVKGYIVLNLKKDGTMNEERTTDKDRYRECFLSCLTIYKAIK